VCRSGAPRPSGAAPVCRPDQAHTLGRALTNSGSCEMSASWGEAEEDLPAKPLKSVENDPRRTYMCGQWRSPLAACPASVRVPV
jgi:hypothetical protein